MICSSQKEVDRLVAALEQFVDDFAPSEDMKERDEMAFKFEVVDGIYFAYLPIPGAESKHVDIEVNKKVRLDINVLVKKEESLTGSEIKYHFSYDLSQEIDLDKIQAMVSSGILKLTLPTKSPAVKKIIVS